VQVAAYDTVAKKMAFFDSSRAKDFFFISGTKVGTRSDSLVISGSMDLKGVIKATTCPRIVQNSCIDPGL
jgi:hypothetical protein